MTRDEAAKVLAKIADFAEVIPGGLEIHRSEKCVAIDALRVAITALRAEEHDRVKHGLANQCVACGNEMPEGDHVCKQCRDSSSAIYPHGLNVRVTDAQMASVERACIQKGLLISEVVREALDAWMNGRVDRAPGFDSERSQ